MSNISLGVWWLLSRFSLLLWGDGALWYLELTFNSPPKPFKANGITPVLGEVPVSVPALGLLVLQVPPGGESQPLNFQFPIISNSPQFPICPNFQFAPISNFPQFPIVLSSPSVPLAAELLYLSSQQSLSCIVPLHNCSRLCKINVGVT